MQIKYPKVGICGLCCRLCPTYHTESKSKCNGCKSEYRMGAGCSFITCALKKKEIEFCWLCQENKTCERWHKHRTFGKEHDTFKCYQKLEDNIAFIKQNGVSAFEEVQKIREQLLKEILRDFNEGRSKRYYCIAATVLKIRELKNALNLAKRNSAGLDVKGRSKVLHSILDKIAKKNKYCLKLRR